MKIDPRVFVTKLLSEPWAMERTHLQDFVSQLIAGVVSIDVATIKAAKDSEEASDRKFFEVNEGVAVIPIRGVILKDPPCIFRFLGIDVCGTRETQLALHAALKDDDVESIVLDVESPGGTVGGVADLADQIFDIRQKGIKPISASVDDLAASAAFWIASQTSRIDANGTALVGSIGVYTVIHDLSRAAEADGVKVHVISSHELKGVGVEGAPVTEAQLDDSKRVVMGFAKHFEDAVARGRDMTAEQVAQVATGQVWLAKEARGLKLIDSIRPTDANGPAPVDDSARAGFSIERIQINAADAAQQEQETMTEEDKKEMERLRVQNAALQKKSDKSDADAEQARVTLQVQQETQKEALLEEYANRIPRAALDGVTKLIGTMDPKGAKAYLEGLPPITREIQEAGADVIDDVIAAEQAKHGGQITVAEKSLGKCFGQSKERIRDMVAIGDAVERVEHDREVIDGNVVMVPKAVMKDGSRLSRAELKSKLGLRGALVGLALFLSMLLVGGDVNAGALSDARATHCRLTGHTKSYLMKVSHTIYAGSLVMINTSGTAESAAAQASNQNVAGVAQETKTSGASGSTWIPLSENVICKFAGTSLGQDDVGSLVYAEDDQTVDETAGSNEPVAGILVQYDSASVGWVYVSPLANFGRVSTLSDPTTMTGDLTLAGGAGALTFSDSASSILVPDDDATALLLGSTGELGLITVDTTDDNEEVNIVGTTATSSFRVDLGYATFDEQAVLTLGFTSPVTGAAAITLTGAAPTMVLKDNAAAALTIDSSGTSNLMVFDTLTANEEVNINGTTTVSAFRVDTGLATFDELVTISGGAGALTLTNTAASILVGDADASALDIGSAGATSSLRYDSTDNAENFVYNSGISSAAIAVAGVTTLDYSDCGKMFFATDAADNDAITLPPLATVTTGCELSFFHNGSDAGLKLLISPNASDGIEGTCTLAGSIVTFSGANDADILITKATGLVGDSITIVAGNADDWYVKACSGIWAN